MLTKKIISPNRVQDKGWGPWESFLSGVALGALAGEDRALNRKAGARPSMHVTEWTPQKPPGSHQKVKFYNITRNVKSSKTKSDKIHFTANCTVIPVN